MLEVDADKRITAEQTLSIHILKRFLRIFNQVSIIIFLFQYADPSDEPTSPMYDQTFEDYDLSVNEWKGGPELLDIQI